MPRRKSPEEPASGAADDTRRLLGAWRAVAAQRRMEDTGEVVPAPTPQGFAVFEPGGRMMLLLHPAGRARPTDDAEAAALFRRLTAYTGRYRIEEDRVVVDVDAAWHPDWEGSEQVRPFALAGGRLTLTGGVQEHPATPGRKSRAVITWERER